MKKVKTLHGWYMIKEGESSEGFLAIIASCKKYYVSIVAGDCPKCI